MSQAIRAWPYSKLRAHIIVAAGARLRRKLVNVRRASGRLENASVWPSLARAVSISWTSDGADSISPDGVGERHVARPVAELGQRDDAAVLGPLDQTAPLRRVESTDVGIASGRGAAPPFVGFLVMPPSTFQVITSTPRPRSFSRTRPNGTNSRGLNRLPMGRSASHFQTETSR